MIYLVCPKCGFSIDIFGEEEASNPIRSRRMKYLLTRDQVCPNCINTIGKCEKVEGDEDTIPILKVDIEEDERIKFAEFCRSHGYAVGTSYALNEFRGK